MLILITSFWYSFKSIIFENCTGITKINVIGANRNTILDFLTDENDHPEIPIQESLKFGEYSLNGSGYAGDWGSKQRLVLKRRTR